MKVLLEGRPGVGKTTLALALLAKLEAKGTHVCGITTKELREGRSRVGFSIEAIDGEREVLAHVDFPGPPRVGKYGVDVGALERVALSALEDPSGIVVIDELGKMELASEAFRDAVLAAMDGPNDVVATVHTFRHPFTDALKARSDVDVIHVTKSNRDAIAEGLLDRMS